jgi:hypothetical protein
MKKLVVATILALSTSVGTAQVQDFELWTGVGVSAKVYKKTYVSLEQNLRLFDNASRLNSVFSEVAGSYRFTKEFKVSAKYRFAQKPNTYSDNPSALDHRYNIDVAYRYKMKPLVFSFRTRFQSKVRNVNSSELGRVPTNYNRNRLVIAFDLDQDFEPYIASEFFYRLNGNEGKFVDEVRFSAGVEYKINKQQEIKLFLMNSRELQVNNPLSSTIVGISYNYDLGKLYKSKGKTDDSGDDGRSSGAEGK